MKGIPRITTSAVCLLLSALLCAPTSAATNEEQILELVNVERIKAGVPPLTMNEKLTESARRYALCLGQAGFFAHVGPDGSTLVTRNIGAGYRNAVWLGENIAAGFSTPEAAVAAWMASLSHRSNILDPNFYEIGLSDAVVPGSPYGHYWVQEFGMRRGAAPGRATETTLRRAGKSPSLPEPGHKGVVSAGGLLGDAHEAANESESSPVIASVEPGNAPRGALITIKGRGFGTSGTLRFGGLISKTESWSDTMITGRVPEGAISSGVSVTNDIGVISRGVGFRVSNTTDLPPVGNPITP